MGNEVAINGVIVDGHIIQTEGVNVRQRSYLDFVGFLVSVANVGRATKITIALPDTDIVLASTSAIYLGGATTEGSWRIIRSGNNLNFERREGGIWVEKGANLP